MEKSCVNCSYYPDKSPCESCEGYSNFDDSWCKSPCGTMEECLDCHHYGNYEDCRWLDYDEEDEE